jgi:hypothetical protein
VDVTRQNVGPRLASLTISVHGVIHDLAILSSELLRKIFPTFCSHAGDRGLFPSFLSATGSRYPSYL